MFTNTIKDKKALVIAVLFFFSAFTFTGEAFPQVNVAPSGDEGDTQMGIVGTEPGAPLPKPGNITVNFKDVDILTVLNYLSEVSGVDIIPTPGVSGRVTMRLRDKPWEVALDIVARNYGFAYSREGDIIRIMPRSMLQTEGTVTEVIPLDHIIRDIDLVKGGTGTEQVAIASKEETIKQLMGAINSMLSKDRGENATYVTGANAIVITAIPAKISDIRKMVDTIDKKKPQILLDAKVIEIILDDNEQLGIDWNTVISAAGAKRPITFPFTSAGLLSFLPGNQRDYYPQGPLTSPPALTDETGSPFPDYTNAGFDPLSPAYGVDSLFTYGTLDFSTFTATLRLLDQREGVDIISSPRLTTLSNQKATIKVVEKIMLQKTQETTQTAGIVTVEFEDEDEAREVGVKLTILPHVNAKGEITVNLMPEVSNRVGTGFEVLTVPGGPANTVALTFASREANTRVRVNDGETIFIGGLIRENRTKVHNKFPLLGSLTGGIPGIKHLFNYEQDRIEKTEIVFFVTVHLIRESLDSILDSQTVDLYKQYDTQGKGAGSGKGSALKTGKLTSTTKQVEAGKVNVEAEEKKRKPLFDFRKK